jgi:hypothetical protein
VEIEEHERFPESWRESTLYVRLVDRSAGVGDLEHILIVNRYDDAAGNAAIS